MNSRFALLVVPLIFLASCASTGEVMPIGPDTYMVGSQDQGGYHSQLTLTEMSVKQANAYCAGLGRRMELQSSKNEGIMLVTNTANTLVFKCFRSDPPMASPAPAPQ
jgi:hypothetical protein